ncbi:NAD(P)-dependent dehydrogenase (short-subunit alcohol dehydrogenase family) [Deinobacterium chartae]|uniref:NAD(P)-dependent dehydrogenase (Short-subunit alcohol dehydrogenase family) n=1 Tax=Deinobacterium chartae TaxID=521158 RepID=A0A841HWU8_9DEIO|nr:SDR family oxidoreductase [Deinobacterium chartae]MBB6097396.1 NAD(P)-dependent dehydrogenase (short-subunit alcohol dehydrogenase family) [Deinobacterium chartae]
MTHTLPVMTDPLRPLQDQVVLVTGGGSGLGAEICRVLSAAGARVVAADLRDEPLARLGDEIREAGGELHGMLLDVRDAQAAQELTERVMREFGRLDVLINNAGTDVTLPVEELTLEDFDRVLQVNLRGPFVMAKAALPLMKQQGRGYIVNIVSTAAKRAWANASAYHASKWGLLGLSHALHVEGRPHRVKVTALLAGGMRTPFILERFPDTPLENLQDPRNVAETIRFLLTQPGETVIPELMVIPMTETSWP